MSVHVHTFVANKHQVVEITGIFSSNFRISWSMHVRTYERPAEAYTSNGLMPWIM